MKDERYDVSADMRLLELQRKAIGAAAHVLQSARFTDTDPLTAELGDDDDSAAASGAILVAQLDAQPRKQLITGALITVSLSVGNDGDALGRRVWASLPLPAETMYRHGTMMIDGVSANEDRAHDFFSNGLELGDILPGARRTLVLKLVLDAGLRDVILSPHVGAASGAVLGLLAVRLMRTVKSHLSVVGERPFYEFDDNEQMREAPVPSGSRLEAREMPAQSAAATGMTGASGNTVEPPSDIAAQTAANSLDDRTEPGTGKLFVPSVRGGNPAESIRKQNVEPALDTRTELGTTKQRERTVEHVGDNALAGEQDAGKQDQAPAKLRKLDAAKQREQDVVKRREHEAAERYHEEARSREQQAAALREQQAAALREQQAAALREEEAAALRERQAAALREQQAAALREQQAAALREQEAVALRKQEVAALQDKHVSKRKVAVDREVEASKREKEPSKSLAETSVSVDQKIGKRTPKLAPEREREPAKQRPADARKTRTSDTRVSAAAIAAKAQTIAESLHVPAVTEPLTIMISDTVAKAKTAVKLKPTSKAAESVREIVAEPAERRPDAASDLAEVVAGDLLLEGKGGPILTVRIDRKRLAALARLFSGTSLGMIAHYLLLNALATTNALPSDGEDMAIAAFVAQQEQLLSRALISTRLGKTPAPDSVAAALPPFPPRVINHADSVSVTASGLGQAVLARAFQTSEIDFLERMLTNAKAPQFLRAAQLFVALCANKAVATSNNDQRPANDALTAYAALAATEISRIFLRAKLTGAPDLFIATEPAFDLAARTVLGELGKLIA